MHRPEPRPSFTAWHWAADKQRRGYAMSPVDPSPLRDAAIAATATAGPGLMTAAAVGVFHPRAMLFGPGVWRGPAHGSSVALTFDDGPHPLYTARIAEIL